MLWWSSPVGNHTFLFRKKSFNFCPLFRNEENVQQAVKELQKVTGKRAEIAGHVCHVGNKEQRSALLDFVRETHLPSFQFDL